MTVFKSLQFIDRIEISPNLWAPPSAKREKPYSYVNRESWLSRIVNCNRIRIMRDWLVRIKKALEDSGIADIRRRPLPPAWGGTSSERSQPWLTGWQRSHCDAVLMELESSSWKGISPEALCYKTACAGVATWLECACRILPGNSLARRQNSSPAVSL